MTAEAATGARSVGPESVLAIQLDDWRQAYERDRRANMLARVRVVGLLHVVAHLLGFVVFDLQDGAAPVIAARLATFAVLLFTIGLSRWRRAASCGFLLSLVVSASTVSFSAFDAAYWGVSWMHAADVSLVVLGATVGFPYSLRQMVVTLGVVSGTFLPVVILAMEPATRARLLDLAFHGVLLLVILGAGTHIVARHREREHQATYRLALEQEKGEQLLLNILPSTIAKRLKQARSSIVDGFSEATVLFADIVGFTPMSEQVAPAALVELLNDVFSRFDELSQELGLEKIKTIGDAYMVAGGLPEPHEDHAAAVAEMALRMREAVKPVQGPDGAPLRLRIGINTGPVVAGVIGTRKFIYDLWGDAVNTASRMESHAEPETIQVTEATYERLRDRYVLEPRGPLAIKGKGEMRTYLLVGRQGDRGSAS